MLVTSCVLICMPAPTGTPVQKSSECTKNPGITLKKMRVKDGEEDWNSRDIYLRRRSVGTWSDDESACKKWEIRLIVE